MKKLAFIFLCIVALCILVFVGAIRGCGNALIPPPAMENDDENYKRGRNLEDAKRDREAMEEFYKVVNSRESAPESHFELGEINLRQRKPLDAIYHFRQYLRLSPDAEPGKLTTASDRIRAAEIMFQQDLPGRPLVSTSSSSALEKEYDKIRDENDALRKENDRLKREIESLARKNSELARSSGASPQATRPMPGTAAPTAQKETARVDSAPSPTAPGQPIIPATHVVVSGDNLSSISKKYYGTSGRWRDIYNYNRDVLTSESALRPGMVLKLPPR